MGIRSQQIPIPTSQIAPDVLDQTDDLPRCSQKITQADIKYKVYYDKKANASRLKKADYAYVLQSNAYHQGSKILLVEFRWNRPYFIEKMLRNHYFLVRKVSTHTAQMLHRMRLRQFTPRQALANVQITTQE